MQDKKTNKKVIYIKILILMISVFTVVLISRYTLKQIRINRFNKVVTEYLQIDNYQDAKNLFERDLKNDELKYFSYGMFFNKTFYRKLKRKYDLEIFHMGCIIEGRLSKYNFYVEEEIFDNKYRQHRYLNKADSIFTYFLMALDTKDYDYLVSNTSDSVHVTPGLLNDVKMQKYEARNLFENYSDRLASFDHLSTEFSNDYRDSLIYIFRKIENIPSNKKRFNLRFCFIEKNNKYYFNELVML